MLCFPRADWVTDEIWKLAHRIVDKNQLDAEDRTAVLVELGLIEVQRTETLAASVRASAG